MSVLCSLVAAAFAICVGAISIRVLFKCVKFNIEDDEQIVVEIGGALIGALVAGVGCCVSMTETSFHPVSYGGAILFAAFGGFFVAVVFLFLKVAKFCIVRMARRVCWMMDWLSTAIAVHIFRTTAWPPPATPSKPVTSDHEPNSDPKPQSAKDLAALSTIESRYTSSV